MTIIEAIDDPCLLGAAIKDPETFLAWRTLLKALFRLPMTEAEAELYRACTGRSELPRAAFAILWLVCGRRGGKSFAMALVAVFMAIFKDWRSFLSPGERAVILLVAADREQAKVTRRYIEGILENPMFAPHVESNTDDAIELAGNVLIQVATCSFRAVRGRSVCVALLDEVAFWRSENTVTPDVEVWRAIRAGMASFGSDSLAIVASSPYARRGLLFEAWRRYYAKTDARNLVWQSTTPAAANGLPPNATAAIDPIFAAIETSRRLELAHARSFDEAKSLSKEKAEKHTDSACLRAAGALRKLVATVPQSTAGAAAMASYLANEVECVEERPEVMNACLRSIALSPALADRLPA